MHIVLNLLLSHYELHACLHLEGHYCNTRQAWMSTAKCRTCVINIFMKNADNIKRFCFTDIYANVQLPRAIHVKDGMYALSAKKRI